ncbi:MAG: hypothetical protein AAB870_01660 [Patescibacteria group bacterium]
MTMKSYIVGAIIALSAVFSAGIVVVHAAEDVLPLPLQRTQVNPNESISNGVLSLQVTNEIRSVVEPIYQRSPLISNGITLRYQTPLAMDRAQAVKNSVQEKQKKGEVQIVIKKEPKKVAGVHYAIATEPDTSSRTSSDTPGRVMIVSATAYSSTPDQTDGSPCITANGYNVCKGNQENVLAANFLPFGTKVRLPDIYGDRIFIVQDRMARRFSNRIDVWMKTRQAAMQFGIKKVKIEVLED